jgi:hypothetical protein
MSFNDGFTKNSIAVPPVAPTSGNVLIYNGTQWVAGTVSGGGGGGTGDITSVTAGANLTGGGASGDVTISLDTNVTGLASVSSSAVTASSLIVDGVNLLNFKQDQILYVSKNGNDTTGNGSTNKPFLTISGAMNSITDASPTKRYAVHVAPGNYTETDILKIKPNVFIVGEDKNIVRIAATSFEMHSTFNANSSVDNRSGFAQCTLLNSCNFDWNSVQSAAGKLYFNEVLFNSTVNLNGYNNSIAQALFNSCAFFNTFTVSGINIARHTNNVHYSNINMNQHASLQTVLEATGGSTLGTVTLTAAVNNFSRACRLFARNFWMNNLTVDGSSSYADLTVSSVPQSGPNAVNGGNIVYINQTTSPYSPSNSGYWTTIGYTPAPTTTTEGLDDLAIEAWTNWLWRKWIRYGVTNLSSSQNTFTVNFDAFANEAYVGNSTNYVVNLSISNTTDASPLFLQTMITSINSSSFTFKTSQTTNTANYKAHWFLTEKTYTFDPSGSF